MSKPKPIRINHFNKDVTMTVTFQLTREFYIRKWVATMLIKLATMILGCGIRIKNSGPDDEMSVDVQSQ
jgi:hypothetical protein